MAILRYSWQVANKGYEAYNYATGYNVIESDLNRLSKCMLKCAWSNILFKDGRRIGKNFISSDFFVFDFDEGLSLDRALHIFHRYAHIIGTTKSHQIEKNGKICDRFRVVIPFDRPITDPLIYDNTAEHYVTHYNSDKACKCKARFYFNCKEIVSVKETGQGLRTIRYAMRKPRRNAEFHGDKSGVPFWIKNYIESGINPNFSFAGRQELYFKIAVNLRNRGWDHQKVESYLLTSKADRTSGNFSDSEIIHAVKSAFSRN